LRLGDLAEPFLEVVPDVRELRVAVPERLRAVPLACRARLAVPPRGRAAPLGARVAMIPTVASTTADLVEAGRRVGPELARAV